MLFYTHQFYSKPFALGLTFLCSALWYAIGCPDAEFSSTYPLLILVYATSAFLEVLAEPSVILSLKADQTALISNSECIFALLQKGIVLLIVILSNINHIYVFCIAQVSFTPI